MAKKTRSKPIKKILLKLMIGALIGLLVAGVISIFRFLLGLHFDWVVNLYHLARQHLFVLFVILLCYGLIVYLIRYWLNNQPEIAGGGGQFLEAELSGQADVDWWPVLWRKFLGGLLLIPSGLVLGRAGPSILMGALVGKGLSVYLKDKVVKGNSYLLAGAIAGLTASFNLPIFALFFIMTGRPDKKKQVDYLVILSASLSSFSLASWLFGTTPFLPLIAVLPSASDIRTYLAYIGLGLYLGFARYGYEKLLAQKVSLLGNSHTYYLSVFVLVMFVGYVGSYFLGGGYPLITYLAMTKLDLRLVFLALLVRFLLTLLSQGTDLPGGAFFPILSLGAMLAVTLLSLFEVLGLVSSDLSVLVLILGMGAFWAANAKFPLLGMVLMVEMTHQLGLILPLTLACLAAHFAFKFLQPRQDEKILDEV